MAKPMTPDQLLKALRDEGLTVHEYPGWRDRCRCCPGDHRPNGPYIRGWGDVNGGVQHITGGGLGGRSVEVYIRDIILYDPDLLTKCQFVTAPDGSVWLVAAGRANHAGGVGSKVRDHMRAADFSTTDDYDDRFRGSSADGNSFTYGNEAIAASSMNTAQRTASVKLWAAIAKFHKWTGQEIAGHGEISSARVKADPNLNMGEFRRDIMTRVKGGTPPVTTPPPKPDPTTVTVLSSSQNMAGNNATGIRTAKSRMAAYIAARKATPVNIIDAQETTVVSTIRARLDSGLKPLGYSRHGGGKGRYQWTRGVKVIAAGLFTVPSNLWYKKDDKQASWVIYDILGARGMDVSLHLESDSGAVADALRVKQAVWIANAALAKAKAHSVPEENIMLVGDTNSEGLVLAALVKAGWRNVAKGTAFENTYTFMGWDGKSRKRLDYGLVRKNAKTATLEKVTHDTKVSDHGGLLIRRQLIKK